MVERERIEDLHQIRAQDQDVVAAKLDADPELTVALDGLQDRAPDAHRLAGGWVGEAADLHIECVPGLGALRLQFGRGRGVRDGGDHGVGQVLRDDLPEQPGRSAGAVAVIGQHHRRFSILHGPFCQRDAFRNGMDFC